MNTAETIFGTVRPGDWVIAAGNSDYRYLIGTVDAIEKRGTPEHGTDNPADDVHVDFTAFDYPPERITEIEGQLNGLFGEQKTFDEFALDDVIMAPDMLIGISHLEMDEITRMGNLRANCEAFCNCFPGAATPQNEKHAALLARIEMNFKDYRTSLMDFGKREIVEMVGKINAVSDAYAYMCNASFGDNELDFLLRFQNPLEIVAEGWIERNMDISDEMGFAFGDVMRNKEDWLAAYPLMGGHGATLDSPPRRYMNVDLADFIGSISPKADGQSARDWAEIERKIWIGSASDSPYDKRLVLLAGSNEVKLFHERDVLIKDCAPFDFVAGHAADPGNTGYFIEATRLDGDAALINVFEIGNAAEYVKHLREIALPPSPSLALLYDGADTVLVSPFEYRESPEKYETHEGKPLEHIWYVPRDRRGMDALLDAELARRMEYPVGEMNIFLESTSEIPPETPPAPEQPPAADKKPSIGDRLKAGKKKSDANRAKNPAAKTKREKEIE